MNPLTRGALQSTTIENTTDGTYVRIQTYKNAAGVESKTAVVVTTDSIQAEIDAQNAIITKANGVIATLNAQKDQIV